MNLVETIKGLKKDVQIYKDDNEKLMKSKEQQDEFNVKLMQSLDRIENKMYKETESSRSRSCRSHDEKIREKRSASRNQPPFKCYQSTHFDLYPIIEDRCSLTRNMEFVPRDSLHRKL